MNLVFTVLEVVAPVFLLAGAGFVWVKLGFDYRVEFVTRLGMTVSLPCLIFVALMQTDVDPVALGAVSAATLAAYGLVGAAMLAWVLIGRLDLRTYLAPLTFGNTGNVGLPLAYFAFGNEGLGYAIVIFAIMAVIAFTLGIWAVSGSRSLSRLLGEPLVWGSVLGGIFLVQGWETPRWLTNTLELTGQMAIPLMLLTLGVAVARLRPSHLAGAMGMSILRIAICLGAAWLTGWAFGLSGVPLAVLVLQISTPVAVTSFLLAEKYGADSDAVAGLVVASTLLAVVITPITLAVFL